MTPRFQDRGVFASIPSAGVDAFLCRGAGYINEEKKIINNANIKMCLLHLCKKYREGILRSDVDIIPSLTVEKRKNRCIPRIYWATAISAVVSNYSNLFLPITFLLDCSHFTFGYELVVCPKSAGLVKIICDGFPFIQRDKALFQIGRASCRERV